MKDIVLEIRPGRVVFNRMGSSKFLQIAFNLVTAFCGNC